MKHIHFSLYALCMLLGASLCMQPLYAEPEEETTAAEEGSDAPQEGSKEWKRAMSIACHKQAAEEYKAMRQLTNMLKKVKNDKDNKKINKAAGEIIKKYSALYSGGSIKVNGMDIMVEDLKSAHTKLGSQRKKMYKDFLEYRGKLGSSQQFGNWPSSEDDSKKKKKKKKKDETVSLDLGQLDQIKTFMRANLGDFADELDAEEEDKMLPMGR